MNHEVEFRAGKNGHDTAAAGAEATIDIKERSCTALSLKMSVSVVSCIRTYKVILYLERYFKRVSGVADMQMLTAPRSLARQHCYYILELIRRVPWGSAARPTAAPAADLTTSRRE